MNPTHKNMDEVFQPNIQPLPRETEAAITAAVEDVLQAIGREFHGHFDNADGDRGGHTASDSEPQGDR